jgi:hypothetical protein
MAVTLDSQRTAFTAMDDQHDILGMAPHQRAWFE